MMDIQNFTYVKQASEKIFSIGFGSKILTRIYTSVDETAPSMDQIWKLPIVAAICDAFHRQI